MASKPTSSRHQFEASKRVEERWTPVLDAALRETGYVVREASIDDQWRGIDRFVTDEFGIEHGVEYKVDEKARRTKRLFMETVSNDRNRRLGCALTSEADWWLHFVPPDDVYVFWLERLRLALADWRLQFPERLSPNEWCGRTYNTLGVCVPIVVAELVAEYVARVGDALPLQRRDDDEEF
jgi:hypothetical protein